MNHSEKTPAQRAMEAMDVTAEEMIHDPHGVQRLLGEIEKLRAEEKGAREAAEIHERASRYWWVEWHRVQGKPLPVPSADSTKVATDALQALHAEVAELRELRESDRAVVCTACARRHEAMDRARYLIALKKAPG